MANPELTGMAEQPIVSESRRNLTGAEDPNPATGRHLPRQPRHVTFRLAEPSDAEFILNLRLDVNKSRHLSQTSNDLAMQRTWLENYKLREQRNEEFYYIIEDNGQRDLGVIRLYDFQNDSFCWGSWILCDGAPSYAAIESALLVYEIAFYQLGFTKSHFDVHKQNLRVLDFHQRFGAVIVDEDEDIFYLNISKEQYERTRQRYRKFFKEPV